MKSDTAFVTILDWATMTEPPGDEPSAGRQQERHAPLREQLPVESCHLVLHHPQFVGEQRSAVHQQCPDVRDAARAGSCAAELRVRRRVLHAGRRDEVHSNVQLQSQRTAHGHF